MCSRSRPVSNSSTRGSRLEITAGWSSYSATGNSTEQRTDSQRCCRERKAQCDVDVDSSPISMPTTGDTMVALRFPHLAGFSVLAGL
jgi:hypothetical protein